MKLNLKYGEYVRIKNTGSELDGIHVRVVGVVSRYITDTYILELLKNATRIDGEGNEYSSFAMWETSLERISDEPVFFGDIVETNGKTIQQNNLEKTHTIPLGSKVEVVDNEEYSVPMIVVSHQRDCDGTPLYGISANGSDFAGGWPEESLRIYE